MPPQPVNRHVRDSAENVPPKQELQGFKVLKAMTTTSRVAKVRTTSIKRPGFNPSPSDSEPRSVAGHVSRERNRVRMAEAAPSNSSLTSSRPSQNSRGGGRRKGHRNVSGDKDDDSDSESDDRDGGSDKDPGQPQGPANQGNDDEAMDDGSSAALAREEHDRVRRLQTLTKVGSAWDSTLRKWNREYGRRRIQEMIRLYGHHMNVAETSGRTLRTSDDLVVLNQQNRRREKYLNDALYGHIESKDNSMDGEGSAPDRVEELIQQAELVVIQRCWAFDPFGRRQDLLPPKPPTRLISIVKNLYSAAWNYLSRQPRGPEWTYPGDFELSCRFMRSACRTDSSTREASILHPFVESYFMAMAEDLSEDLVLDIDQRRKREGSALDTLRVCERIQTSRDNDHLTPTFSAWVSPRLSSEQKQDIFLQWNQNKQQETLSEFRRLMDLAKMTIRQEFCANIVSQGQVSLVLFKEDWPSAIKDVTPDELRSMGWTLEAMKGGAQFVRLETHTDTSRGQQYIVKVSMDEEILAMRGLNGRQWIYWEGEDCPLD